MSEIEKRHNLFKEGIKMLFCGGFNIKEIASLFESDYKSVEDILRDAVKVKP